MKRVLFAAVGMVMAASAMAQQTPAVPAQDNQFAAMGEIRVLHPSSDRWSYTSYRMNMTEFDLNRAGWYRASGWSAMKDPSGNTWLVYSPGIYVEYAVPMPRLY